ncbi:unnamed protein product [Echinostoma caproni]|uniref:STAS domain-containing protein n=1 Tax=Echinostoma caproni TaxID=27848 RepID=A0A183AK62_9TREM|nr:unnamed protein product [Echinostoma caproni]
MTGQSLKVANVSAQKIVSNLDENDYVAVAHFPGVLENEPIALVNANNETEQPCFKSFVRATKKNKMRLFHDLGSIKARGYARFDKALLAAFKMFENIRVLIYALGDPVSTIDEYERAACKYRGNCSV